MPKIKITQGSKTGRTINLESERNVIGRDPGCEIVVSDSLEISRRHACIYRTDGRWLIEDLGSSNATRINGKRIKKSPLASSDHILVGDFEFIFEDDTSSKGLSHPAGRSEALIAQPSLLDQFEYQELVSRMSEKTRKIENEISKAIIGQKEIILELFTAILSGGHVLMVGMPGLAKTMIPRTIAQVFDLQFCRIEFTPDLMPSDLVGSQVLEIHKTTSRKEPHFIQGPIFTNILLADGINRTPPKTQAALFKAMQEYRVAAAGEYRALDLPFFVIATQNPLEQEGVHPLSEAQLDRFMFSVFIDYPREEEEEMIAKVTTTQRDVVLKTVLTGSEILELQQVVRSLPISRHVVKYATRLVRASRPIDSRGPEFIKKWIHCGAGLRATQSLVLAAKARAIIQGRLLVTTDDIRAVAHPVLRHRIFTNFAANSEGVTTDQVVEKLLEVVPEPSEKDY